MVHLEVRVSQGNDRKGDAKRMQITVSFNTPRWFQQIIQSGLSVSKGVKSKLGIPFRLSSAVFAAVDFTSATSPLSPYIHFGCSLGPPPHSSAPVRGFPAACKLHAHIWTEDVTCPLPPPPSTNWGDGVWRCNKWRPVLGGNTFQRFHFFFTASNSVRNYYLSFGNNSEITDSTHEVHTRVIAPLQTGNQSEAEISQTAYHRHPPIILVRNAVFSHYLARTKMAKIFF